MRLTNPNDPVLSRLVGDLSISTTEFRERWVERRVAHQIFGSKLVRHPRVGDMTLEWRSFHQRGSADQQLVVWSAEPGSDSYLRLDELAGR